MPVFDVPSVISEAPLNVENPAFIPTLSQVEKSEEVKEQTEWIIPIMGWLHVFIFYQQLSLILKQLLISSIQYNTYE